MLKIAVHDRQKGRRGRQHALDTGRGQAAAPHPLNQPHPRIAPRQLAHALGGAIRRIVVDEDEFPGDAIQYGLHAP